MLEDVSSRGRQDPRTGKMDSPVVNAQRATADQEVLNRQASLRHASFPLNRRKIFVVYYNGISCNINTGAEDSFVNRSGISDIKDKKNILAPQNIITIVSKVHHSPTGPYKLPISPFGRATA